MELEKKVRDAFGCVKASEGLKESTKSFLREAGRNRQAHRGAALRLATVCAALAVFLGIGGFAFLGTPVAYVSIDVNPSLELELNRLDRVIAVRAFNEDGERIAAGISVKGMRCEDALEKILDSREMQPYLTQDAALTFTVATESEPKEAQLLSDIARSRGCTEHGGVSVRADMSLVGEAHENGLSLGKYLAYRLLVQYEPSVTVQDCHDMSMSQLHGMLEEHEHGTSHGDSQGEHETGHETEHGTEHKGQYEGVQESEYPMEYDGHKSGHGH